MEEQLPGKEAPQMSWDPRIVGLLALVFNMLPNLALSIAIGVGSVMPPKVPLLLTGSHPSPSLERVYSTLAAVDGSFLVVAFSSSSCTSVSLKFDANVPNPLGSLCARFPSVPNAEASLPPRITRQ